MREGLLVVVVTVTIMLAGCTDLLLSPEERVEKALADFSNGMGPDGSVRKLEGDFEGYETSATVDVTLEIGSNDVVVYQVEAGVFSVRIYCTPEGSITQIGSRALEGRTRSDACPASPDEPEPEPIEGTREVKDIQEHDDGTLSATVVVTKGYDVTHTRLEVDEDGRIVHMEIENSTGRFAFDVSYGERRQIDIPRSTQRRPADVSSETSFQEGTYTWEATAHGETVSLDTFEVRVMETDDRGNERVIAAFDPSDPATQEEAGFRFEFDDNGDGHLTTGDAFTVQNDHWQYEWEYDIVVWDKWAGRTLGDVPLPYPSPFIIVAVTVAASVLWSRRE